jgi:hypothetical protein
MVFVGAVMSGLFLESGLLRIVAVGAAISLLFSQAMMLYRCSAVPMWRDRTLPVAFISSGCVFGYGMMLLFRAGWGYPALSPTAQIDGVGMACLIVNAAALALLLTQPRPSDRGKMLKTMKRPAKMFVMVGLGQLLPLFLLVILGISSTFTADHLSHTLLYYMVGVFAIIGSLFQKLWMIRDTQYLCGMEIGKGGASPAS